MADSETDTDTDTDSKTDTGAEREADDARSLMSRLPNTNDWASLSARIQDGVWDVSGEFSGAPIWEALSAHERLEAARTCAEAKEKMREQLETELPSTLFGGFFPEPSFVLLRNRSDRPWDSLEKNRDPQAYVSFPRLHLNWLPTAWPELSIRAARLRAAHERMLCLLDGHDAPLWRAEKVGTGGFTIQAGVSVRASSYVRAERMVLLVLLRIQILVQKKPNAKTLRVGGLRREDGDGRRAALESEIEALLQ